MPEPSSQEHEIKRINSELRGLLVERYHGVVESFRSQHCPEEPFDLAVERYLPQMAQYIGYPDAPSLDALIDFDLDRRSWAVELGVSERWGTSKVLMHSDNQDAMERNLAEGLDVDTDRLSLSLSQSAALTARLAAHDQMLAGIAEELKESMVGVAKTLGMPPETTVRQVIERLDEEMGGQLLGAMIDALAQKLRDAKGLSYDPTESEMRKMILKYFDEV